MSRSYRKSPFHGIACGSHGSDKQYKKMRHKQERIMVNSLLKHAQFDLLNYVLKPYDSWASFKDGKQCLLRLKHKDFAEYQKLMRK